MTLSCEIIRTCKVANIEPGDTIFLHGDSIIASEFEGRTTEERLVNFFYSILDYLGPHGTLIVPNFTYSFTRGLDFDVKNSKSMLGPFSEVFRLIEASKRSHHPIFSVSAIGKNATLFSRVKIDQCFGSGSCFELLHRLNGKISCVGTSINVMTFVHYVEQTFNVDYRFMKSFTGNILFEDKKTFQKTDYFVRTYDIDTSTNLSNLKKALLENQAYHEAAFGRIRIVTISSNDFFEASRKILSIHPHSLINQHYINSNEWKGT